MTPQTNVGFRCATDASFSKSQCSTRVRHARARGMAANLAQEIRRGMAENARVLAGRVEEEDEESEGGSESEGDGDESESDDVQQSGSDPSLGN